MTTVNQNPYVGPRTFTYEDRKRYFGREREAEALLARVISQRLVLFYAQSGAGKSSLINTQLVPELRQAGFEVLPVGRVGGDLPAGVTAVDNIYLFNLLLSLDLSNHDPQRLTQLTLHAFLAALISDDGLTWSFDPTLVAEASTGDDASAVTADWTSTAVDTATTDAAADDYEAVPYVLIIDQFEEILTNHSNRWEDRAAFFQQLNDAMRRDPNLWVVLTLREDYIAGLDPYARYLDDRMRARFYMERMGVEAALAAITKPAAQAGRPFAAGVAEQLVDNLRQIRVQGQPQPELGQYLEPVQLQVVCYQLWENLHEEGIARSADDKVMGGQDDEMISATSGHPVIRSSGHRAITLSDLERSGDVDSALADFYESAIGEALAQAKSWLAERELRHWFDTQLITAANTRGTVYRGADTTAGMRNEVIDTLQNRFLLRTEQRAGGYWVELVHDRFVEPIQLANNAWRRGYVNPAAQAFQRWQHGGQQSYRSPTLCQPKPARYNCRRGTLPGAQPRLCTRAGQHPKTSRTRPPHTCDRGRRNHNAAHRTDLLGVATTGRCAGASQHCHRSPGHRQQRSRTRPGRIDPCDCR